MDSKCSEHYFVVSNLDNKTTVNEKSFKLRIIRQSNISVFVDEYVQLNYLF